MKITKESPVFSIVNEFFRDKNIETSEIYNIVYADAVHTIITNKFGTVIINANNNAHKVLFNKLAALSSEKINLEKDFLGTKFHNLISQAIESEKRFKESVHNINSQVFIIKKINGRAYQLGLGDIINNNPELVNTLTIFSIYNLNQAFTEKQACSLVCEAFASVQGENLLDDSVVEQLRNHIHNIKKIYKYGFILTERIN